MKLNSVFALIGAQNCRVGILSVAALLLFGCASAEIGPKLESRDAAAKLGLAPCTVSVPLSASEAERLSELLGNPDPNSNPEWQAIRNDMKDGDELRSVNCTGVKGTSDVYYFGLIRNGEVALKFHPTISD